MQISGMKKITIAGITCLSAGIIFLITGSYFYEVNSQFMKKIQEMPIDNSASMGGPIQVPPYYLLQPFLSIAGIILIIIGVFLLSYGSMKKTKNFFNQL